MQQTINFQKHIIHFSPVKIDSSMHEAFDLFRKNKQYNFLPVINSRSKPVGILREFSIKDYTYGMYGRELIRNMTVGDFTSPCTVIPFNSKLEELLCLATADSNTEGCIISKDDQYYGVILNKALINIFEEHRLLTTQWLQRASKMEAIGTLAGGIAHDFNNILTPILGYSELLHHMIQDEKLIEFVDQIQTAGHRAKELVNQILTFSRQKKEERVLFNISTIVKEVAKLLNSSLPSKVKLETSFSDDSDTIMADPINIHRVVTNLCSNAIHAMRENGGILEIALSKGENPPRGWVFGEEKLGSGQTICLTVSDTGSGINHTILERIFDPFFTTKSPADGTGLGLSVAHGIVKGNNGLISVETQIGKGSRFHVYFPVARKEVEASTTDTIKGDPQGNNHHILFIDDEEMITGIATESLEIFGFRVSAFTNSMEAYLNFQKNCTNFDAIITDQTMPGLTGTELAKKILHIRSDIPIILCTGFSNSVNPETARAMGIAHFFYKPVIFKDIAEKLCQLIGSR